MNRRSHRAIVTIAALACLGTRAEAADVTVDFGVLAPSTVNIEDVVYMEPDGIAGSIEPGVPAIEITGSGVPGGDKIYYGAAPATAVVDFTFSVSGTAYLSGFTISHNGTASVNLLEGSTILATALQNQPILVYPDRSYTLVLNGIAGLSEAPNSNNGNPVYALVASTVSAVPLPGTVTMFSAALVGLLGIGNRRAAGNRGASSYGFLGTRCAGS